MKREQYQSAVEAVRTTLRMKHIIWDRGSCTLAGEHGSSSIPCEDSFEGEIFQGDLAGCRLSVDRLEANGKVAFMGQLITGQGPVMLDQQTSALIWHAATGTSE